MNMNTNTNTMNTTTPPPTPETDAAWASWPYAGPGVHANFARKLERERDEAREELQQCLSLITKTKAILQEVDLPDEPLDVQAQRMVAQHDWQLGIARGQAKQIEQANGTVHTMREAIKEAHEALKELRSFYIEMTNLPPCAANAALAKLQPFIAP